MKKLLFIIIPVLLSVAMAASCSMHKNHGKSMAEKDNKPAGTINMPDTGKRTSDITPFPNPQPVSIPNPNPNPPSPNPPMR